LSCPICGAQRGTNVYCWNHVNSDSSGYSLPYISDTDLIKYDLRVEKKIRKYGRAVTLNEALKGEKQDEHK